MTDSFPTPASSEVAGEGRAPTEPLPPPPGSSSGSPPHQPPIPPPSSGEPGGWRSFRVILWLLSVVLVLGFVRELMAAYPHIVFDDAFMFVRYALHVKEGLGLAWNPDGIQTYGCTSLLHVVLLVAMMGWLPLSPDRLLFLLSSSMTLLFGAMLMGMGWLSLRTSTRGRRLFACWVLLCAGVLRTPPLRFHATSGMDTSLALVCVSLFCIWLLHIRLKTPSGQGLSAPPGPMLGLASVGWLCFLARPDTLIYVLVTPLLMLWPGSRPSSSGSEHPASAASPSGHAFRPLLLLGGFTVLWLALDTALKLSLFGEALPLPFYAKQSGALEGYRGQWWGLALMVPFLLSAGPGLLLMAWSACVTVRQETHAQVLRLGRGAGGQEVLVGLLPLLLTFVVLLRMVQIMGFEGRFYMPGLPVVYASALLAFQRWLAGLSEKPLVWSPPVTGLAAVGVLSWGLLLTPPFGIPLQQQLQRALAHVEAAVSTQKRDPVFPLPPSSLPPLNWWQGVVEMSQVVHELPQDSVVLMTEYGLVGARSPDVTILDPLGLHDAKVAHEGFSAQAALDRAPLLIWMPHPDYPRLIKALWENPQFQRDYDFIPGMLDYGVAVRKSGAGAHEAREALRRAWLRAYAGMKLPGSLSDE